MFSILHLIIIFFSQVFVALALCRVELYEIPSQAVRLNEKGEIFQRYLPFVIVQPLGMLMDDIRRHCISSKSKIGSKRAQCRGLKTYRKARSWDLKVMVSSGSSRTGTLLLTRLVMFLPMSEGNLLAMPVH